MTWDLATKQNWELVLSESRIAIQKPPLDKIKYDYSYTAINPIYASPESHVLLIGTYSQSALPHWFLGARASQYLYVSPSPNGEFINGVQVEGNKQIGLNRLTLIEFKNYNVTPYVLQLEIPYWIEDIYVEVWQYKGNSNETNQQYDYEQILQRLTNIELILDKIRQIQNNQNS